MIFLNHFRTIGGTLQQLVVSNRDDAGLLSSLDLDELDVDVFREEKTHTAREWLYVEKKGKWVNVPSFESEEAYLKHYGIRKVG